MFCPFCRFSETKVIDSRLINEGARIKRRRKCEHCNKRFNTIECIECFMPEIIKRNGKREEFDQEKVKVGLLKALEKRPISSAQVEVSLRNIQNKISAQNLREINSEFVGECVMNELKKLDEVAYIRFISVYSEFKNVNEFKDAVINLEKGKE